MPRGCVLVGNALYQLGQKTEAVKKWERCVALNSKLPDVHNNLSVAYWKLGELKKAQKHMMKAEELGFQVHPEFKDALEFALYNQSKKK